MKRRAFSLVETVVALAIASMGVGLIMPAIQKVRESANRTQCQSNLRQIGLATHSLHESLGILPDGGEQFWVSRSWRGSSPSVPPYQTWGWGYQILPYSEQASLWQHSSDNFVFGHVVGIYVCPSRGPRVIGGRAMTDYAGNAGTSQLGSNGWGMLGNGNGSVIVRRPNGQRERNGSVRFTDFANGTSNTLLFGEKCLNGGLLGQSQTDDDSGWVDGWDWDIVRWTWAAPARDWYDPNPTVAHSGNATLHGSFGGLHDGLNVVLADGSVRSIAWNVDAEVWKRLGMR